jgi:hypothetical protein
MVTWGVTNGNMLSVIWLETAVTGETHTWFEVTTTFTWSPLLKEDDVNVALFAPAGIPLTCHWYDGAVPPLTTAELNVAVVPSQKELPGTTLMLAETERTGFTVTVITLLVAVAVARQFRLEVIETETCAPLVSVDVVNTCDVPPETTPLTNHWYVGIAPPDTGLAVNVISSPAQTGPPGFDVMETDGATGEVTLITMVFDVASGAIRQFSDDVRMT